MKLAGQMFALSLGAFFLLSEAGLRADALANWHQRNPLPTGNLLRGVAFGNGVYVAVGTGTNGATSSGVILTSTDGSQWTEATNLSANTVVYGAGRFVAVGGGPSLVSTNGRDWIQGVGILPSDASIAYGNGLFVVAGGFGVSPPIFVSADGLTWTNRTVSTGRLIMFEGVAFGNGAFMVTAYQFGGGNSAFVSTDGTNWTHADLLGDVPFRFAFGNGVFAGVMGYASGVATSSNGLNWTSQTNDATAVLNGIGFANGVFGAVGDGGVILTSSDGVLWTRRTTGSSNALYAFGGNDNSFVAVGDAGTILQSDDTRPHLSGRVDVSSGGAALSVTGGLLRSYRLQASDRLPATNWTDLLSFTNTALTTNFVDTSATNFDRRFYRLVSP